jgi:type IV pilus assembly protein PilE
MQNNNAKYTGFTLTELIIVVAIVGILASISYPNYIEYVKRTARVEAATLLLDAANKQEQFFVDNRQYSNTLAALRVPAATENDYFTIAVERPQLNEFTITATAVGGPVNGDEECTTLTIDELGVQGHTGTAETAARCWGK